MDRSVAGKKKRSKETVSAESNEGPELLETIDAAIQAMKELLKAKACEKGSISDLVRLLQLRKELDDERPRHINVRWIDEDEC
jgi:hypothetical protein